MSGGVCDFFQVQKFKKARCKGTSFHYHLVLGLGWRLALNFLKRQPHFPLGNFPHLTIIGSGLLSVLSFFLRAKLIVIRISGGWHFFAFSVYSGGWLWISYAICIPGLAFRSAVSRQDINASLHCWLGVVVVCACSFASVGFLRGYLHVGCLNFWFWNTSSVSTASTSYLGIITGSWEAF